MPPDALSFARSRGRRAFLAATTLGLGGLFGCLPAREPLLRVASHVWPGYETLFLARRLGWLDDGAVRLVELLSASDSLHALYAGGVEGAALTLDEVLTARAEGLDLRVVLVFDVSAGADALLARPDVARQLAELAGKRVGVEHSAVGALMLASALRHAGLPPSAVTAVPLTVDAHREAYLSGRVDALVTYEPTAAMLEAEGALRLFDSRAIPGRVVDVLALTPRALADSRGAAKNLVAAHFRALDYLRDHAKEAMRMMAPRLALSPAGVGTVLRGLELPDLAENRRWLRGAPAALETAAADLAALMWRERLLPREIGVAGLADASLLPDAAA